MNSFNINDELSAFCQREVFKTYVKNAINDEMFWRDLFQRYNITSMVDTEISNKVPNKVKKEIDKLVPTQVELKLNNFTSTQLPNLVVKEVNSAVPNYLNNSSQMQQILNYHSSNLNKLLQDLATETLNKVVNEDQYHITTNLHLTATQQKCDSKLSEINQTFDNKIIEISSKANDQLQYNSILFKSQLEDIKTNVNTQLKDLREGISKVDKLYKKIDKLEKENISMKWMLGGVTTLFTGLISIGFYYLINK